MAFIRLTSIGKIVYRILLTLLIMANISMAVAFAASPSAADAEEQNRRARQEAEERQKRDRQKDVFLHKGKILAEDTALPDETTTFAVDVVVLAGDAAGRFPWAQAMVQRYAGRRIGAEGISLIVKRLTGAFIDHGYITTQVSVPEQDLSTGTLKLIIIPGRIGAIRFAATGAQGNWQTAFPARPGDILNLRQLEQGLEQMMRVPSQNVDIQIAPGNAPGVSDIVISLRETSRWRGTVAVDDSGLKATGRLQVATTLAIDNPLRQNDLLSLSFNGDGDRKGSLLGTRGNSFSYSVPSGDRTFSLSGYTYRYHQTVDDGFNSFVYSGESRNLELKLTQLLGRDQTSKTNLELGIIKSKVTSFLDDVELDVQRQNTTAFKVGLSHRRYAGPATIDVAVGFKLGVPWLGAQTDPASQLPGEPTTRYRIWLLDASISTPVALGSTKGRYTATFHGQYTRDLLFGTEALSIGNRYTVRGFDGEQTLYGERGWYLRNELAVPLGASGQEAYAGLDYGLVAGPTAHVGPGRVLAGAAVGLRGGGKTLSYDVFAGWPLRRPDGFQTASPTYGFQLVCQI